MKRDLFEEEHEDFRFSFRRWLENEIVPHSLEWEHQGIAPRHVYSDAGALGFLGMAIPSQYGGGGVSDFRFNQVVGEEVQYAGVSGSAIGLTLHNDVCTPYFLEYCTDEQRERWLPGIASGELITAIAMTEPGVGSDLAAMTTTARRDVDCYVVNGAKTFITNGINADLVVTAVKTSPERGSHGVSLLVLERGMPGFERGRNLEKLGMHAQDTAELFFSDVAVPTENLLGQEGSGFQQLMHNLRQERMSIAIAGVAAARFALGQTLDYVKSRKAFGQTIGSFQNSRFTLAEVATEVQIAEILIDRCVSALNMGELSSEDASMAKWWCTELQNRAIGRCLQLHGGYGYMMEYPIARAYADARVTTIYGGTTEIMKEIIGKSLGLA